VRQRARAEGKSREEKKGPPRAALGVEEGRVKRARGHINPFTRKKTGDGERGKVPFRDRIGWGGECTPTPQRGKRMGSREGKSYKIERNL